MPKMPQLLRHHPFHLPPRLPDGCERIVMPATYRYFRGRSWKGVVILRVGDQNYFYDSLASTSNLQAIRWPLPEKEIHYTSLRDLNTLMSNGDWIELALFNHPAFEMEDSTL